MFKSDKLDFYINTRAPTVAFNKLNSLTNDRGLYITKTTVGAPVIKDRGIFFNIMNDISREPQPLF